MKILLLDQIATVNYKYSYSLANALKSCGNEVEMVIDDKKDNEYCLCKCHNKFLTARKDIGKVKKAFNYCSSYRYIIKKAVKEKFDIVHVQWFQLSPVDCYYLKKLKKRGIKVVITVHDILPFNQKPYDMNYFKKLYSLGDNIIVQTEANIKRFNDMFPNNEDKVSLVPHGHYLDFADVHDKTEARKYIGIPQDKKVLLFFGQIKKVKGVGVLLEAFGRLCKKRNDAYLVIAGSVWKDDFAPYEEIINKYGLTDKQLKTDIRFIPNEEMGYYYSACDIGLLPYTDVYQSGVIQLCYAYKKPVIATDLPAFTQFAREGASGFLCERNDYKSLEAAMERALDNIDEFGAMGEAGYNMVKDELDWNKLANKITEECYK